jgi:hypothetical protein
MAFLDDILFRQGRRVAGEIGQHIPIPKVPSLFKSALTGSAIGGIVGLARGNNYDETSTFRNFISGAAVGAGIGFGARGLIGSKAVRGLYGALTGPVPKLAGAGIRTGGKLLNAGMRTAGFLARHPTATLSGAAVLGGAAYMSGAFQGSAFQDAQMEQYDTGASFRSSTAGLTFGLHRKRHR